MSAQELLRTVYAKLADEHDEHPRSEMMLALSALIEVPEQIPHGERIEIVVTMRPGGAFSVEDQHGRPVAGVSSVAAFPDQSGKTILQVNL